MAPPFALAALANRQAKARRRQSSVSSLFMLHFLCSPFSSIEDYMLFSEFLLLHYIWRLASWLHNEAGQQVSKTNKLHEAP